MTFVAIGALRVNFDTHPLSTSILDSKDSLKISYQFLFHNEGTSYGIIWLHFGALFIFIVLTYLN